MEQIHKYDMVIYVTFTILIYSLQYVLTKNPSKRARVLMPLRSHDHL